mmetsp:Transcript_32634/g.75122  ORF Transcript_32634/g.75122 Transcript_32634/m.75122 type:complete len:224 (-) Transcript_32634:337-1008(-)
MNNKTSLESNIASVVNSGKLVPDLYIAQAVKKSLEARLGPNIYAQSKEPIGRCAGYLLDGFPRTVTQAKIATGHNLISSKMSRSLEKESAIDKWPPHLFLSYAIHIDVPDWICASKIAGRRYCEKCSTWYNTSNIFEGKWRMPPILCACKRQTQNKAVSLESTRREDDVDPNIVQRRLADYHTETKPVLDFFQRKGKLLNFIPYHGLDDLDQLKDLIRNTLPS